MGYAYMSVSMLDISRAFQAVQSINDLIRLCDLPADVEIEKYWSSVNAFEPAGSTSIIVLLKSAEFAAETPELAFKEPPLAARAKEKT